MNGTLYKGVGEVHDLVQDGTTDAGIIVLRSFCEPVFTANLFPFEEGLDGPVSSLLGFDDGAGEALWIGGRFSAAAGQQAGNIARWQNGAYAPVGSGFDEEVRALAVFDDGNGAALYAGGRFVTADGGSANHIARWDGTQWSPLGLGLNNPVHALLVFDDGGGNALYVGGNFSLAGGAPASRVARWKNGVWEAVGDGFDGPVYALAVFDDGNGPRLVAGGNFYHSGANTTPNIARFNAGSWESLGDGLNDRVNALTVFDEGSGAVLIAGGSFTGTDQGEPLLAIARFDGTAWSGLGNGLVGSGGGGHKREGKTPFGGAGQVGALQVFDGGTGPALMVAGTFQFAGAVSASNIARWQGGVWWPLAQGITGTPNPFDYPLFATCFGILAGSGPSAKLYLGGPFDAVDYQSSHYLAEITCESVGQERPPASASPLSLKGEVP